MFAHLISNVFHMLHTYYDFKLKIPTRTCSFRYHFQLSGYVHRCDLNAFVISPHGTRTHYIWESIFK